MGTELEGTLMATETYRAYDVDGNLLAQYEVDAVIEPPSREESIALAARLSVIDKVRANDLDDDTVSELVGLFSPLTDGLAVAKGEVYAWDGTLVEVVQNVTVEGWWLDLDMLPPAIFNVKRTPPPGAGIPGWEQPDSTNPYPAIDPNTGKTFKVTDAGRVWENSHGDGNVWRPGDYGWRDIGPA